MQCPPCYEACLGDLLFFTNRPGKTTNDLAIHDVGDGVRRFYSQTFSEVHHTLLL